MGNHVRVANLWATHDASLHAQVEEYGSSPLSVAMRCMENRTLNQHLGWISVALRGHDQALRWRPHFGHACRLLPYKKRIFGG